MISNKDYETHVNFTFYYSRLLLSFLGVWPMVSKSTKIMEKIIYKLITLVVTSLMLFATIPCLLHIIFREKDLNARIVSAGPMGFNLASFFKFSMIIYRRDAISNCFNHIEEDWKGVSNEADWKIMRENVQAGRNLTVACAMILYPCAIIYYLIMPLWTGAIVNEFNETLRTLVSPGYDSFIDVKNSPTYELVLYGCFVGVLFNSTAVIASCNLAAIFVAHACGQFQIIVSRLASLLDSSIDVNNHNSVIQERIKVAVRRHVRVLGFSKKIEEALQEICCIEVVASTLIICLDEYYCMMEWKNGNVMASLTYAGIFVSFSFNIFILCLVGEWLKEQCNRIETAAYMSEWYKLPGKSGLAMVNIIGTINYPRKLTAGYIMELSISSFGSIMKSTLAYLNMLRTLGF